MALRRADHSSKESYRLCKKDYETEEEARAQQMAEELLMKEYYGVGLKSHNVFEPCTGIA
jgi:hypothetical protein